MVVSVEAETVVCRDKENGAGATSLEVESFVRVDGNYAVSERTYTQNRDSNKHRQQP